MNVRFVLVFLLFSSSLFAAQSNLVVITIDTLRADHLGAYGYRHGKTPNLDGLAERGLLFLNALAPAPLTLPSHTSLFTGRYPYHHGVRDNAGSVPPNEMTLAEMLGSKGYHTYAFVGGFPLDHRFGLNQGFDVYDDLFPREPNRSLDFRSERNAENVIRSLFATKLQTPFFLWVHFYDPHAPYLNGGYDGEIAYVDRQIGMLLKHVVDANTFVAVAGDHGESLGEHGEWTHRIFVYESTMRVPFLITGPGIPSKKFPDPVRLIDFLPTILSYLKVPVPQNLDGVALNKEEPPSAAVLESFFPRLQLGWSPVLAVRTKEWKYIEAPKPELYNMQSDPREKRNVFQEHPDVVKKLRPALAEVMTNVSKPSVSAETAEQLAALGYVSGGNPNFSGIDAKDGIGVWNQIEQAVDLEKANPAESISILESARKKDPTNPMVLGFLAQKYAEAKRWKEAKMLLHTVLKRDPLNSLALYRMAFVCLEMNNAAEAKSWAQKLHAQEQKNADALILLARAHIKLGELAEAAENLKRSLDIDPRDHELRLDLGNLYLQMRETGQASSEFRKVLAVSPNNLQALNGIASAAFAAKDYAEAKKHLQNAFALDPSDPQTQLNLALLYSKQGKIEEAIILYRKVIDSSRAPEEWRAQAASRLKELSQ